ncbi:MAG: hypothetical protein KIC80_01545 [Brachyspira sp.]|nr:hypothetical protein [Brachyspira sp.]
MQVQNNSGSQVTHQSFKGKIDIMPGNLSYNPSKCVRKAYNSLEKMIKDKPFDLFIRQDAKTDTVRLIAQKPEHYGRKNKPIAEAVISGAAKLEDSAAEPKYSASGLYISVAKEAISEYEKKFPVMSFSEKAKKFFNNLGSKFMKIMQDE